MKYDSLGLINKQLMSDVHRANPKTQGELREAAKAANLWLHRSFKQGLVPGQVDHRALTGLTPSSGIAVMLATGTKKCKVCNKKGYIDTECWQVPSNMKCFGCGKTGHIKKNYTETSESCLMGMEALYYNPLAIAHPYNEANTVGFDESGT